MLYDYKKESKCDFSIEDMLEKMNTFIVISPIEYSEANLSNVITY